MKALTGEVALSPSFINSDEVELWAKKCPGDRSKRPRGVCPNPLEVRTNA